MTGTELAIILAAVVIGSVAKSVTGMGLPLIAVPIAALFVDIEQAVVVIALPNLLANCVLASRERHHVSETRDLPVLAVSSVFGSVLGTLLFVSVPSEPLVVALILAIAMYIVLFFTTPDLHLTARQSARWSPAVGSVAGVFQGAIGISGPIIGAWVQSLRLTRSAFILSVTTLFFVSGSTQFAILVVNGDLSGRVLATVLACVPVLATIPIGTRLRDRFSSRGFDLAIIVLLAVSSIALCIRTFA